MAAAENDFAADLNELPLRLYFQDEGRFGRINRVQKCWCRKGIVPKVTQQLIREYSYAFTAVCPQTGDTCSLIMPHANSEAMTIFLQTLAEQQSQERIILCMDRAGWHTTNQLKIPKNIIIWFLPPYSPELNPVELIWRELRAKYFNNITFQSMKEVENHLEYALIDFVKNKESIKKLTKINYL
ncbi:MAG TPA: IS630 family transposase [Segetibacter sp.]|nr:IS630 family transposase [Segetibacter sp.]